MSVLLFDMGLPMIIPSLALMAVALVPIVLIEAFVVRSALRTDTKKVLISVATANVASTFIGIPATWFLLYVLELASVNAIAATTDRNPWTVLFSVTLGSPWVAPGVHNEQWVIMGAMLFLLIPYGLASWAIEYLVIKTMFPKGQNADGDIESSKHLKRVVGKANLVTYCLLAVFVIVVRVVSLPSSN